MGEEAEWYVDVQGNG